MSLAADRKRWTNSPESDRVFSSLQTCFCIRLHNGKSGYGPWRLIFQAVVP
jgi:hypothetical protein